MFSFNRLNFMLTLMAGSMIDWTLYLIYLMSCLVIVLAGNRDLDLTIHRSVTLFTLLTLQLSLSEFYVAFAYMVSICHGWVG